MELYTIVIYCTFNKWEYYWNNPCVTFCVLPGLVAVLDMYSMCYVGCVPWKNSSFSALRFSYQLFSSLFNPFSLRGSLLKVIDSVPSSPLIKCLNHPPSKKRNKWGWILDYSAELHSYSSLHSSINSHKMHFDFTIQNCFCDHMSFLWHCKLQLLMKEAGVKTRARLTVSKSGWSVDGDN